MGGIILACKPVVGGSWGSSIFWKILLLPNLKVGKTAVKRGKIPPLPSH